MPGRVNWSELATLLDDGGRYLGLPALRQLSGLDASNT